MPPAVHTIDDFLQVLRRSELVDPQRLDEAVAPWPDHAAPLPDELPRALVAAGLITDWHVEQLRKGKHRGFMLGKYRLLRLLGAGGMSSVYLAEHATLHGKVAIKVLPRKNADKASYLARFEREARAAFRLSHPNIVRTIDLDVADKIHFLAMEYIDGVDLHAKVKQEGRLSLADAANYVRQAALGLQYAHEEGIVHRDIKPANLILDRRGTVKILDLGLALASRDDDEDASLTQEHGEKVLGTADYLAPEQVLDSHKADRRSDIYALGCTLYYLLVGRAPFASGSAAERMQAHRKKPAPNLLEERSDVPPAIAELYFRMLEKHPDARPQSAKEVADALAPFAAAENAERPTPARAELPRRSLPRRGPGPLAVERSGPGSSGVGSSGVSLGLPVSTTVSDSGSGRGLPRPPGPPPPKGRPQPGRAKQAGKGRGKSQQSREGDEQDDEEQRPRRRRPLEFAGLPIGFWIVAGGGLLLAIGLGVQVYLSRR